MENEVGKIYHRPWGTYETLSLENSYQVKRLIINPNGRLSLQKHLKRCEHWIIVEGEPTLTIGEEVNTYHPNDTVFIPVNTLHRIENFTSTQVVIIEVQKGEYLGEDDIIRIDDLYGRE